MYSATYYCNKYSLSANYVQGTVMGMRYWLRECTFSVHQQPPVYMYFLWRTASLTSSSTQLFPAWCLCHLPSGPHHLSPGSQDLPPSCCPSKHPSLPHCYRDCFYPSHVDSLLRVAHRSGSVWPLPSCPVWPVSYPVLPSTPNSLEVL